jgi:hypothetical protein
MSGLSSLVNFFTSPAKKQPRQGVEARQNSLVIVVRGVRPSRKGRVSNHHQREARKDVPIRIVCCMSRGGVSQWGNFLAILAACLYLSVVIGHAPLPDHAKPKQVGKSYDLRPILGDKSATTKLPDADAVVQLLLENIRIGGQNRSPPGRRSSFGTVSTSKSSQPRRLTRRSRSSLKRWSA